MLNASAQIPFEDMDCFMNNGPAPFPYRSIQRTFSEKMRFSESVSWSIRKKIASQMDVALQRTAMQSKAMYKYNCMGRMDSESLTS